MRSLAIPIALIATAGLSARLGAQGRGCSETRRPVTLPPPNALVDSARAVEDLAAFASSSRPMVFSLVFDSGQSVPRIHALDKSDAAAAVALANYVRRQPPAELWAIRVHIAAGDTPALTLERSIYCPPVPPKSAPAGIVVGVIAQRGYAVTPLMGGIGHVEVLVSNSGRVLLARTLRPSGVPEADYDFVQEMRRQQFQPARLDGEPIAGVYRTGGESPRP